MRTVKRLHSAVRDDIGNLTTRRPLPGPALRDLDPFLFLNHHGPQVYPPGNRGLPFGPHPHRGFETVTFILEGQLAHLDTGGHESVIDEGGVQWMTAGRGLVHSELSPQSFMERGGPLEILQLWVNLPARLKMVEPGYTGLQRHQIPSVPTDGGGTVNLISGEWHGRTGPIRPLTDVHMSTVYLAAGRRVELPAASGRTVFLYVVRGQVQIAGRRAESFQLVELNDDGEEVHIEALVDSILIFGHATPLCEPIVAHGPFVMNTGEEITQAIRDYEAGLFG